MNKYIVELRQSQNPDLRKSISASKSKSSSNNKKIVKKKEDRFSNL